MFYSKKENHELLFFLKAYNNKILGLVAKNMENKIENFWQNCFVLYSTNW